jgi:hypothetical protein
VRPEHGHVVAGTVIAAAMLLFVGSLLAAILLRATAQWVMKRQIEFWSAYSTVFYATLVNLGIGFVTGIAARVGFPEHPGVFAWTQLGMVFVYFLVTALFVRTRQKVTLLEAMLLCLCMYWLALAIIVLVGAAVWRVLLWARLL